MTWAQHEDEIERYSRSAIEDAMTRSRERDAFLPQGIPSGHAQSRVKPQFVVKRRRTSAALAVSESSGDDLQREA
jgi:hypothetical protein